MSYILHFVSNVSPLLTLSFLESVPAFGDFDNQKPWGSWSASLQNGGGPHPTPEQSYILPTRFTSVPVNLDLWAESVGRLPHTARSYCTLSKEDSTCSLWGILSPSLSTVCLQQLFGIKSLGQLSIHVHLVIDSII